MSCCGRGGSWFKNCGGAGNAKLHHTWYEGIQSCKTRSQSNTFIGNELNGAQQKDTDSSEGADMANYKAGIADPNTSTPMSDTTLIVTSGYTPDNVSITTSSRTLITSSSTQILTTSSTHTSVSTSISTHGCLNLLEIMSMTIFVQIKF